ncbi:hypothetical protein BG844_33815 [Couchioplanes caeruleus subsp. caeruleus]|uniref:Secreted protein n=1 Tax=Couchioplanes caeruleus subsp. caeruleus TaxID=56427 RepID=A0A1K0FYI7_9ACTN|nr:hypothetical protein BG844_33815 [Couchioplanes caeruleus subsp. caeruleus]
MAAAVGVLASLAVASPALAVYSPEPVRLGDYTWIGLYTDHDEHYLGAVWLTNYGNGDYGLRVCDYYSDGYYVSARIDPGNGDVQTYNSLGVGESNCLERDITYGVRKFRLAWKNFASAWAAP